MSDSDNKGPNQSGEPTALERYLAKQKQVKAARHEMPKPTTRGWAKAAVPPPSAPSSSNPSTSEEKALEVGVPQAPPQSPVLENAIPEAELGFVPGDMLSRMVAFAIDLTIVWALTWPIQAVWIGVFNVFSSGIVDFTANAIRVLSGYTVVFVYYGWFYTKKGASPGKLLMGLQIVDSTDGGKIGYWKAFFREAIGKWISAIPLGIGYLTAFFRDDRRALHDLLFDTAVVRGPSAKNKT